jgi:hypothetical protein
MREAAAVIGAAADGCLHPKSASISDRQPQLGKFGTIQDNKGQ